MNKPNAKETSTLCVRMPSDLMAKLKQLAKSEDRSLNKQVVRILTQHFK